MYLSTYIISEKLCNSISDVIKQKPGLRTVHNYGAGRKSQYVDTSLNRILIDNQRKYTQQSM